MVMNLLTLKKGCIFLLIFLPKKPTSELAAQFDDVTGAALHNIWVIGEFSTAVSGSVKSLKFEWKPVWVGTTALFLGIDTSFGGAIVDSVPVS
jgi:hypothetical protein